MKYRCEIRGVLYVEADNEQQARENAKQTNKLNWDWDDIEVEEDFEVEEYDHDNY